MAVICAEVDPKAMADTGGKGGSAGRCLGPLHSRLMIVLQFSTALLSARVFIKSVEYFPLSGLFIKSAEYCPGCTDNGGAKKV